MCSASMQEPKTGVKSTIIICASKKSSVPVEIHWHITRPNRRFSIDIDGLWERAQLTTIAGVEALTLSVEDLLLHLCQHMHKHNLIGGIRPLCDIAHVVEHYNNTIDWMEFRTRSDQWGISPYVYLALYFAKEFLVAHIPSSFLDGFEPAGFNRAVIDWAKERLLDCESSSISHNLVQLSWNGHRFEDRLAALGSALAPAVVAQSYGLPQDSNRIPFHYYPQRIKDLLTSLRSVAMAVGVRRSENKGGLGKGRQPASTEQVALLRLSVRLS